MHDSIHMIWIHEIACVIVILNTNSKHAHMVEVQEANTVQLSNNFHVALNLSTKGAKVSSHLCPK